MVAFVGSIGTAFTGYLSQSNFDSQWISTQAKDGLNSVGIGALFNVLNSGQMLLWHVVLLPLVVGVLVVCTSCWCAGTASCRRSDDEARRRREPDARPGRCRSRRRPAEPVRPAGRAPEAVMTRPRRRRDRTPDAHVFPTRPVRPGQGVRASRCVVIGRADRRRWPRSSPRRTSKPITLRGLGRRRRRPTSSPPPPASWPAPAPARLRPAVQHAPPTGRRSARCRCRSGAASGSRSTRASDLVLAPLRSVHRRRRR